ncbi:MAG: hypothetical protein ACLRSE_12295 [Alistipes finegoldii]
MGQKGQRSDTHTLTHEAQTLTRDVVTAPFRLRTYRLIRKILIGFILVSIANVLFSYFFYTPKMYRIIRENRDLVIKYRILQDRIRTAQRHVDEIRHRDNYVYRSLFSTDTMSIEGVWQPYPDTKYAALLDDDYAPLMVGTWRQARRAGPHALPRIGVVRRTAGLLAGQGEDVGGGSGHLAHRPFGAAQQPHRRILAAPLPPRTPPRAGPHGRRFRLRPGYAGIRHRRRRGGNWPSAAATTAATAIRCS